MESEKMNVLFQNAAECVYSCWENYDYLKSEAEKRGRDTSEYDAFMNRSRAFFKEIEDICEMFSSAGLYRELKETLIFRFNLTDDVRISDNFDSFLGLLRFYAED